MGGLRGWELGRKLELGEERRGDWFGFGGGRRRSGRGRFMIG